MSCIQGKHMLRSKDIYKTLGVEIQSQYFLGLKGTYLTISR